MSRAMLEHCRDRALACLQADARSLPLRSASFDHAVLPLMLHHVAGSSAADARANVATVFAEVRRVLTPGGRLFVSEFCVDSLVYAAELVAVPITRRLLALAGSPLVMMHSRRFYARALVAAGFCAIACRRIRSADARATDWIRPIIGLPGLKIPRALYPISPTLITARAPR